MTEHNARRDNDCHMFEERRRGFNHNRMVHSNHCGELPINAVMLHQSTADADFLIGSAFSSHADSATMRTAANEHERSRAVRQCRSSRLLDRCILTAEFVTRAGLKSGLTSPDSLLIKAADVDQPMLGLWTRLLQLQRLQKKSREAPPGSKYPRMKLFPSSATPSRIDNHCIPGC